MIGQGLTLNEVTELVNYIQENNSWENIFHALENNRPVIKYYQMYFDTRSGEMWKIKFHDSDEDTEFRDSPTFKQDIYNYLDRKVK